MSSKSRKPKPPAEAANPTARPEPKPSTLLSPASLLEDDELIHAPKGASRVRFVLTVLLVILLLVIFMLPPSAFSGAMGGGGDVGSATKMAWNHPSEGRVELTVNEFLKQKQDWDVFFRTISRDGRSPRIEDEAIAGLTIFDALAIENGVDISNEELVEFLLRISGGDVRAYKSAISRSTRGASGVRTFEETLRRYLRYDRYLSMMTYLGAPPSVSAIEELWNEQHGEYSFDYAMLAVADFEDDAEASLTDDSVLQAWFDGLGDPLKNRYRTPEKTAAEQIRLRLDPDADLSALLAAYPLAEDADLDALARGYYDKVFTTRFRNQQPENATPDELRNFQYFTPVDAVLETCKREAPLHKALSDFALDLAAREEAGTPVDIAAEAAALGLAHDAGGVARSYDEWRDLEDWGGSYLAGRLGSRPLGKLSPDVLAETDALIVVRLQEKQPPAMPEFAEIRDKVLADWKTEQALELAVAALEGLRDGFGTRPAEGSEPFAPTVDAAVFNAAVEGLGASVQTSKWIDKGDRNLFGAEEGFERFLARNRQLFTLESGQVSAAKADTAKEHVYLVRCTGVRELSLSEMKPLDYQSLSMSAGFKSQQDFQLEVLGLAPNFSGSPVPEVSGAVLRERYGLELYTPEAGDDE